MKPAHKPAIPCLLLAATVSLLLAACAAPAPREPPPPFGTYPEGAEGPCAEYLAELRRNNDAGALGEIYDLNDPDTGSPDARRGQESRESELSA